MRQRAANAQWQKGHSKFADDLLIEALAAFEEVDERFGGPAESAGARRFAYEAMLGHAAVRCATGDLEEGLAEFDRIVDRLGDDAAPEFVASAAKALGHKAAMLAKNERPAEAVDVARECVKRFGHVDHPLVQIEVAAASAFSLDGLRALGRYDDVVATAEDVVARVGDQLVPYYRELRVELVVAGALMNKADALKELGYRDAALAALDEIMFRFGSDREPALLRMVAGARAYAQQLQRE